MIISASRRTDIPAYYSEWFFNRIKEGVVYVRNPMNVHQVSKVSLNPDVISGIVFWTKNPIPMMDRFSELAWYNYYFQFTLNAYQDDVEINLPSKNNILIPAFQKLSDILGPDRVIWRYDPIFLSKKYSIQHHIEYFEKMARRLKDYTRKCTISFIDYYKNTANNMRGFELRNLTNQDKHALAKSFSEITHQYGIAIDTCAESIDLSHYGISHARCIDGQLLEKISGVTLEVEKDKFQRLECGCVSSIDIGAYNSCKNGCKYCYANYNQKAVAGNFLRHNVNSPSLLGDTDSEDRVTEKKIPSKKAYLVNLFEKLIQ